MLENRSGGPDGATGVPRTTDNKGRHSLQVAVGLRGLIGQCWVSGAWVRFAVSIKDIPTEC